jgi:hypothetical protein
VRPDGYHQALGERQARMIAIGIGSFLGAGGKLNLVLLLTMLLPMAVLQRW